jgi:hypothetical protein
MRIIARIRFAGGMLMLPSRTPYDIEILLENLEWYATRYGGVRLELDRHHWGVERGAEDGEVCARCRRGRAELTFVNGTRVPVCRGCVRAGVASLFANWPEPALRRVAAGR